MGGLGSVTLRGDPCIQEGEGVRVCVCAGSKGRRLWMGWREGVKIMDGKLTFLAGSVSASLPLGEHSSAGDFLTWLSSSSTAFCNTEKKRQGLSTGTNTLLWLKRQRERGKG